MRTGGRGSVAQQTPPARIPPLPAGVCERTVALTLNNPPDEATHWTAEMMAKAVGISVSSVQRIWRGARTAAPAGCARSSCRATGISRSSSATSSGAISEPRPHVRPRTGRYVSHIRKTVDNPFFDNYSHSVML
jgi:hypothetical protein